VLKNYRGFFALRCWTTCVVLREPQKMAKVELSRYVVKKMTLF